MPAPFVATWVEQPDHAAANRIDPCDIWAFVAVECAEKYLKALLEELGLPVPKVHELDALLTMLLPHHSMLKSLRRGLLFLTDFAVDTRYPGNRATKRQAKAAVRWAEKVRNACRTLLGAGAPDKSP